MEKNYDEGGLRMIDISRMQISIALKWITKINESGMEYGKQYQGIILINLDRTCLFSKWIHILNK